MTPRMYSYIVYYSIQCNFFFFHSTQHSVFIFGHAFHLRFIFEWISYCLAPKTNTNHLKLNRNDFHNSTMCTIYSIVDSIDVTFFPLKFIQCVVVVVFCFFSRSSYIRLCHFHCTIHIFCFFCLLSVLLLFQPDILSYQYVSNMVKVNTENEKKKQNS